MPEKRPTPPPADPDRRAEDFGSCRRYCEIYLATSHNLPSAFFLPLSPDQLRVIEKFEEAATRGERLVVAMPRGSGIATLRAAAKQFVG